MALVRQPTRVTFTFRDRKRKATSGFFVGDVAGQPPDPMQLGNPNALAPFAFLQEFYDNMKDVSDCAPLGYQITYSWADNATIAYGATPNVERKGVMAFRVDDVGQPTSIFTWPGLKDGAQAPNGQKISYNAPSTFTGPLAADLQSIHDKLRNGATIGASTFPVTDYRGKDFADLIDAYQQTRSSNGQG